MGNLLLDCDDCYMELLRQSIDRAPFYPAKLLARISYKRFYPVYLHCLSKARMVLFAKRSEEIPWRKEYFHYPNYLPLIPDRSALPFDTETRIPKILFIGTLGYYPNHAGIDHFIRNAWPGIKAKAPGAVLKIVGRGLPSKYMRRWRSDDIEISGYLERIEDAYSDVLFSISPVYHGSGTHMKVLESLAYGRTMVVTPKSLRGYEDLLNDKESLLVALSDSEFTSKVLDLLNNSRLRHQLARSGYAKVLDHHHGRARQAVNQEFSARLAEAFSLCSRG